MLERLAHGFGQRRGAHAELCVPVNLLYHL